MICCTKLCNVVWIHRFLPLKSMQLPSTKDRSLRTSVSQLQMQESERRRRCEHRPFQSLSNGGQKRRGKRQAVTLKQKKQKTKRKPGMSACESQGATGAREETISEVLPHLTKSFSYEIHSQWYHTSALCLDNNLNELFRCFMVKCSGSCGHMISWSAISAKPLSSCWAVMLRISMPLQQRYF